MNIPFDSVIHSKPKSDTLKLNPENPDPCAGCSNCCEYIALQIDTPTSFKDFDYIFWYLVHKNVWVYIDEKNEWYVQFNTECEKLEKQRCNYYPQRPQVCRDYMPESCTRYNKTPTEKILLKKEEHLWEYLHYKRPAMYQKLVVKYNRHITEQEKGIQ